jgi:hypothetical protein
MTHKNRKTLGIFMFLSAGCSLLRVEGFSGSLGVLYGIVIFYQKIINKFPAVNFFFNFWS